jgi:hypothetical protein
LNRIAIYDVTGRIVVENLERNSISIEKLRVGRYVLKGYSSGDLVVNQSFIKK